MTWTIKGIRHPHGNAAYDDEVARGATLILEARLLRQQGEDQAAADRFAEAARIEGQLASICDKTGFAESANIHRFSVVDCLAEAGDFHQALAELHSYLKRSDLSDALRRQAEDFAQALERQRRQYYAAVVSARSVEFV